MPLATLHLISLLSGTTLRDILNTIRKLPSPYEPIILSKPIRWVILPEKIDAKTLLQTKWDLLYIHLGTDLPSQITSAISNHYTLRVGIPSRLLKDFANTNKALLDPSSTLPLTGALDDMKPSASSQDLSLSKDLQSWVATFSQTKAGKSAVSMLNLLSFKPDHKHNYITYGQEFAKSIGSRRGGNAKLVGHVVRDQSDKSESQSLVWEEFALAHYPSILHFADMLASRDYQEVNQKYRVPSLSDTCILCTSEIEIGDLLGDKDARSKL